MTKEQLEKAQILTKEIKALEEVKNMHSKVYENYPDCRHDYYNAIGKCIYHLCLSDQNFDAKFFFLIDDTLSDRELEFSEL